MQKLDDSIEPLIADATSLLLKQKEQAEQSAAASAAETSRLRSEMERLVRTSALQESSLKRLDAAEVSSRAFSFLCVFGAWNIVQ